MARLLSLIALMSVLALPAWAAPAVDKAGADALRPRVESAIAQMAALLKERGIVLKGQGGVMVEPAGEFYAITTPSFSLAMPDGVTRMVGMLAINAIPTDDPDIVKVAVAIPTPIVDTDAKGARTGTMSIGRQTMAGLWHLTALAFVDLQASYQDIRIDDLRENRQIVIPSLTASLRLARQGSLWSGPLRATAAGLAYKSPAGAFAAREAQLESTVTNLDIAARGRLEKGADGLGASAGSGVTALAEALLNRHADAASNDVRLSGVTYDTGKGKGTIDSARLLASFRDLRATAAAGTWSLDMSGIADADPSKARVTPTRLSLKGSGTGLPLKALLTEKRPEVLNAAMSKAGTQIVTDSLQLEAPAYALSGSGLYRAPAQAQTRGSGNLDFSARGMPELVGWLSGPDAPRLNNAPLVPPAYVGALAVMQLAGKPASDSAGNPVLAYDVRLNPDGTATLNGADVTALLQGARGPVQKAR